MPTTPLRRRPTRLVVVQLSGGNDYLNTVVPYHDSHYRDARPTLGIPADEVLQSALGSLGPETVGGGL